MISNIVELVVMLNPFALYLYLQPVIKDLDDRAFLKVFSKATMISFGILLAFVLGGDFIFSNVFHIHLEAFRIFGGIVIFSFAYHFIVKGRRALIRLKGSLDDLASEIALPFMIGAGTISLTIFAGREHSALVGVLIVLIALLINYVLVLILKEVRSQFERRKLRAAFDYNMSILLRLNGFFVGSIGINMILVAINNLYF